MPNSQKSDNSKISEEASPYYLNKITREQDMYKWWTNLGGRALLINARRRISIINTGTINEYEGPDFLNCSINIGGKIKNGAVELHLYNGDWYRHKHHINKLYNTVILHIALFHEKDIVIRKENRRIVPQIYLSNDIFLSKSMHHPCYRVQSPFNLLYTFAIKRIRKKYRRMKQRIKKYGYRKALVVSVAEALGYIRLKRIFFNNALNLDISWINFPADFAEISGQIYSLFPDRPKITKGIRPNNCYDKRIKALIAFIYNFSRHKLSFEYENKNYIGNARLSTIINNVFIYFQDKKTEQIVNFLKKAKIRESTLPFKRTMKQFFGTEIPEKMFMSEFFQQAAIELYNNYCRKGLCRKCVFARSNVKKMGKVPKIRKNRDVQ